MATVLALIVIQYTAINFFTYTCTCEAASGTAGQASKNCAY